MSKIFRKKALRIFLSYSHKDRKLVHTLWSRLEKDGMDVWLDKENLQPGQNWEQEIRQAILASHITIVCLSQEFIQHSGFRHEELKIAIRKAKSLPASEIFIIPVRLEKCDMPQSLRHIHRVDLFERGGYKKLLLVLQGKSR